VFIEMSKRNIGKEILTGLEEIAAWKRGEIKLKVTKHKTPSAKEIAQIRQRLGLTQCRAHGCQCAYIAILGAGAA